MNARPEIFIQENGNLCLHVPLKIKYKDGRKLIIAPNALDGEVPGVESPVQESLVQMIARGSAWMRMIEDGTISRVQELVAKTGYHRTHIGRILQVANLAPELTEAILEGNEPDGLSITRLKKPIPESWEEQSARFGCNG